MNISVGSVFTYINHQMHVGGVFCDWAKASDCVNHEILLAKLHFYETQGDVFFMRIDDLSYCFVNCL